MITLNKFVDQFCPQIKETEEFRLKNVEEDGIKGNSIDSQGRVCFAIDDGTEVLLVDILRLETFEDLQRAYKETSREALMNLYKEFYSQYFFISPEMYRAQVANQMQRDLENIDYWEKLAEGIM